ncbi:acetate kinase [Plantactinospora sp. B6F1]|uniref:acetate/propionate family kinase n=1 Tax=Plantactinospora sp. B6F1 TaxID=3158971 RepID=UPI00102C01D7
MTRVLVLNCGSSSLKYRLFDGVRTVDRGLVERIGEPGGDAPDHASALRDVLARIDLADLGVVGHRVVHGGTEFTGPTVVDDDVVAAIERLVPLAPLHNPANLTGITVARQMLPRVPQVAIFDTAFHTTMPPAAATYALDADLARRLGVRRYGFHGTSHAYVARQTARLLERPSDELDLITLHLGNGASACAVSRGRSVATSMGLSPLAGLVMGTRSGDLDPAVLFHLHRVGGLSVAEIDELLNHRSGLLGLTGDNDMRGVLRRRAAGDPAASLAFDVYCRRLTEYVGAYLAVLGRLDAITFTGGVGEHAVEVRAGALAGLSGLGIVVDPDRNERSASVISPPTAPVRVCVIPTDEEREIAEQALAVLTGQPVPGP